MSTEISTGVLLLCNGKVITSVKTLCQHAITWELNDNSLCWRVIMRRKCNFPGFGVLIYVRCDRINPPMKYQKTAKLLDNYRHITNIFVWADENINLLFWHSAAQCEV